MFFVGLDMKTQDNNYYIYNLECIFLVIVITNNIFTFSAIIIIAAVPYLLLPFLWPSHHWSIMNITIIQTVTPWLSQSTSQLYHHYHYHNCATTLFHFYVFIYFIIYLYLFVEHPEAKWTWFCVWKIQLTSQMDS